MTRLRRRIFDGISLVGSGGGAADPGTGGRLTYAQRESLTFGNYVPNASNTGLLPGYTYGDLEPVTTNFTAAAGTTYENKAFYCQVTMARGSFGTGPTFRNCLFAGVDPDTIASAAKTDNRDGVSRVYQYAADTTPARSADNDTLQWLTEDCVLDPGAWFESTAPGGARTGNMNLKLRSCLGWRGGNGTHKRLEVKNAQDGLTVVQAAASSSDPSFYNLFGVWVHDILHYSGADHWQAEGTHDDSIQFHFIKNMLVRGCRIEVSHNAGAMIQLENAAQYLENIIIEDTIFEPRSDGGSGWGINLAYKAATTMAGCAFRRLKFIQRGDNKYVIARNSLIPLLSDLSIVVWDEPGVSYHSVGTVTVANGGAP